MENLHTPILLKKIKQIFAEHLEARSPTSPPLFFDGTFGRGGHTAMLLSLRPDARVIATDQDPEAIVYGQKKFKQEIQQGRLKLVQSEFSKYLKQQKDDPYALAFLDLGVSSPQLDQGQRGFSFNKEGPLDMRMNPSEGVSAAKVLNTAPEEELIQIFRTYGEIDQPQRVVKRIMERRDSQPFATTLDLAFLIESTVPAKVRWKKPGFHPATLYFQALRIFINRELESLETALPILLHQLESRGLLAVLTFHSLEDRIVKNAFRETELGEPLFKKVLQADESEIQENPRSRSAKLRVFKKEKSAPKNKNKYAHLIGQS